MTNNPTQLTALRELGIAVDSKAPGPGRGQLLTPRITLDVNASRDAARAPSDVGHARAPYESEPSPAPTPRKASGD